MAKTVSFLFLILSSLLIAAPALAIQEIVGTVTLVEGTYMPAQVTFLLAAGATGSGTNSCPAGSWMVWKNVNNDLSNNTAVYAGLLSALSSGKKVRIIINDNDTTCKGVFVHFLNS